GRRRRSGGRCAVRPAGRRVRGGSGRPGQGPSRSGRSSRGRSDQAAPPADAVGVGAQPAGPTPRRRRADPRGPGRRPGRSAGAGPRRGRRRPAGGGAGTCGDAPAPHPGRRGGAGRPGRPRPPGRGGRHADRRLGRPGVRPAPSPGPAERAARDTKRLRRPVRSVLGPRASEPCRDLEPAPILPHDLRRRRSPGGKHDRPGRPGGSAGRGARSGESRVRLPGARRSSRRRTCGRHWEEAPQGTGPRPDPRT
ncbi:MAG: hypothetical protein AVDCRST_MAG20-309, partial [uncultured Acidimicrobiales bacterium]